MLANHLPGKQVPSPVPPPTGRSTPAPRLVFCISPSRGRADSILVDLLDEGIAGAEIAILFLDPDRSVGATVPGVPAPASSGPIRGVIASLEGARRVVMPDVGPVIVSGGLSLPAGGAPVGLPRSLESFGVPQPEAARLAGRVAGGHFFIAVRTAYSGTADSAREVFLANHAEEVCTKLDVLRPGPAAASGGSSPGATRS